MEAIRVAHDGEGVVERLLVVQDRSCCGPSEVDILVLVLEHLFRLGGATQLICTLQITQGSAILSFPLPQRLARQRNARYAPTQRYVHVPEMPLWRYARYVNVVMPLPRSTAGV